MLRPEVRGDLFTIFSWLRAMSLHRLHGPLSPRRGFVKPVGRLCAWTPLCLRAVFFTQEISMRESTRHSHGHLIWGKQLRLPSVLLSIEWFRGWSHGLKVLYTFLELFVILISNHKGYKIPVNAYNTTQHKQLLTVWRKFIKIKHNGLCFSIKMMSINQLTSKFRFLFI